jgi:hypothetical protein
MSQLENACKNIITPMVNGQHVALSREERELLAAWTVKTSMVAEHTVPGERFWRPDERRAFAEPPHTPPPCDTQIVAAHYSGGRYRAILYPGHHTLRRLSGEPTMTPATNAAIVVGRLVLQVMADRHREITGRMALEIPNPGFDRTTLVWPAGGDYDVPWPRPGTEPFRDDTLGLFVYGRDTA